MALAHIVCETTHSVLLEVNGRHEWVSRHRIPYKQQTQN